MNTPPSQLNRVCEVCKHRLITVVLDTGVRLELDTQCQCYVITGREAGGIPIYVSSRSYVKHVEVCRGETA